MPAIDGDARGKIKDNDISVLSAKIRETQNEGRDVRFSFCVWFTLRAK